METKHTSEQNLNELVFENRNKAYGAYVLRASYDDHVIKALFVSFVLAAAIALLAFLSSSKIPEAIPNLKEQLKTEEIYITRTIEIEKPKPEIKIEEKLVKPPVDVPKSDNMNYHATDNKEDVVEHTNEEASINKNGKPDGNDNLPTTTTEEPTENIGTSANKEEAEFITDEMPEFNGNLFQFIRNNVEYPQMAKEMGTSGTVVLQFVVEKDGSIDEIKILKSVPDGCTAEAIRVVKAMPKWKPGKNKGRPVRVLFNLPIKFTLK